MTAHPRVSVINLMDLVTKLHKNLSLPGFVCLFACFLTKSFGSRNYTNVVSVVTAGLSLCEKDSLEASFI